MCTLKTSDEWQEKVDSIFSVCDRVETPGCAIAIIQDGEITYKRGYGSANLDHKVLISSKTAFDLASESKQFTATCVALLDRKGMLSLEDKVLDYIPGMPHYGSDITIRHLIHHTSGIPEYYDTFEAEGLIENVITSEELIELIFSQSKLDYEPGTKFQYCNSGYILLAAIVEKVTNKSFSTFSKEAIFDPLGMTSTCFYADRDMIIPNRATGYVRNDGNGFTVKHYHNFTVPGDGRLYSTVEDLFLWDQNFYSPLIGDTELLATLLTPGVLSNGETTGYGFGLDWGAFIKPYRGLRIVAHGGACAGFQSIIMRFPDQKFSVIILCNTRVFNCIPCAYEVADLCLFGEIKSK